MIEGTVWMNDPNSEDEDERETVQVRLDNGFEVNFWLTGLSEDEYIKRANQIYEMAENKISDKT